MQLRPEDSSRGQVIIVAALVIAAIFVGLALVLNSGIYAENLSSRETTDTDGALSFTLATDETVAEAYERTNSADKSSASGAETTFNNTMDSWESAQQRRGAMQGIGIDVEHTAHVGWRLEQGTDRNFTSNSRTDDWQLVTGASDVGAFEMEVTQNSLYNSSDWANVNDSFHVRVSESGGGDDWDLYVFQKGGDIVVHSGAPGSYDSYSDLDASNKCTSSKSRVVIDFNAETVGTSSCGVLNFSDNVSGAIDIFYRNVESDAGDEQVNGTYTLVVNGTDAAEKSNFNAPTDDDPTAQAVVYSVSYASHYEKADMTYERRGTHAVREETYAS